MKKNSFSLTARTTFGALFLIFSVVLVLIALNVNVLEGRPRRTNKPAAAKEIPKAKVAAPEAVAANPSQILFSHNTHVDFSFTSGEPFINSAPVTVAPNTPAGSPFISVPFGLSTSVSLLWKSIDGGRSFIKLGAPIVSDPAAGPGGGDTHQDFDALGRFYYSDLGGGCVTTAVSDDGGNTFPKTSPLTCIGPGDPGGVTDDRQWSGAFGDGRGYMTVRNLAVSVGGNFHLNRTRDAGVTWLAAQPIGTVTQSGPLVVDKTKRNIGGTDYILAYQIYYTGGTLKMFRIQDPDTGGPVTVVDLTVGTPGGSVATVFPVPAVDNAGNVYATWSNGTSISMATSTNHGTTWSLPKRVSPILGDAGTGTIVMPWIIAGDAGRVDVVWYRGSLPGNSTNPNNRWDIYMGQSLNALDASPTWSYTKVNEHTIHFGEICLAGLNCDIAIPPGSRDRSFLEFPSITLDHRGAAMITWNDNTNQSAVTAASPQVTGAPYVMFSKQICGPSLFASVGNVGETGTVAITSPTNGASIPEGSPVNVTGTHTLPPGTFDKDEAGDGKFPDHGPAIGANIPAMDIRQVDMTDTGTHLNVNMQVADATTAALAAAPALSGGDGLLYLIQWDYDEDVAIPVDRVFWVAAEIRGGQAVGRTGTLGVVRSATSKKFITYNPDAQDSLQVTVTITNTAPGTITMSIPKSLVGNPPNGALLKSVTGYAMSERGALTPFVCPDPPASCENAFNPSSLPIQVDAAGAFTYIMGGGLQLDGVVELSLDDPNFSTPTPASANNDGTWQYSFNAPGPGQYTLYARQIVRNCATSPTVSTSFVVPPPPEVVGTVSRKTHGTLTPPFDVPLPGIECRTGGPTGDHEVVITFAAPVSVNGTPKADVTAGSGDVGSGGVSNGGEVIVNGSSVTVPLTNVANAQTIVITLFGVSDGTNFGNVSVQMGVLAGDTTEDGSVNSADISETKSQSGQTVTETSFRTDVTIDGFKNSADISLVKSKSGTALPSSAFGAPRRAK